MHISLTKAGLAATVLWSLVLPPAQAAQVIEPVPLPGNFQKVSEELSRGATPSERNLTSLKRSGIKSIINLRMDGRDEKTEKATARRLGLKYFHIPMDFGTPSPDTVHKFLSAISDKGNQPVYVHCRQGADRTGTLVAIYRIISQGWGFRESYKEMRRHHFKPWLTDLKQTVFRYSRQPLPSSEPQPTAITPVQPALLASISTSAISPAATSVLNFLVP